MDILQQLKEPFDPKVVKWRCGSTTKDKSSAIALAYVDARHVMKRLDDVCGVDWQCRYPFEGCCDIGVKLNGEWVWRSNGAGASDIEGEKGQYSDAFKRAAVLFGIGRYLYQLPIKWMPIKPQGRGYVIAEPPVMPVWATPEGYRAALDKWTTTLEEVA